MQESLKKPKTKQNKTKNKTKQLQKEEPCWRQAHSHVTPEPR